jgi:hypothetical protein
MDFLMLAAGAEGFTDFRAIVEFDPPSASRV